MSSIAYVTDEKMLEYHRLCGSTSINFWRLSGREKFRDFHRGDLLFFYAHGLRGRKKGFVGYAHYEGTHTLSLKQMWDRYGTLNGYDTMAQMQEAIEKAARDHQVPAKMNCLYLSNVVFFRTPVYPKDVGISINEKLESYTYLDQNDPGVTVRILREAEKIGIDVWSASQTMETEAVFQRDALNQQLGWIAGKIQDPHYTEAEKSRAAKLVKEKLNDKGFQMIRGSRYACYRHTEKELEIALPYVTNTKDHAERLKELLGTISLYRYEVQHEKVRYQKLVFRILYEEKTEEVQVLLREINKTDE